MSTINVQLFDDEDWLYGGGGENSNSNKEVKSQQSDSLSNKTTEFV